MVAPAGRVAQGRFREFFRPPLPGLPPGPAPGTLRVVNRELFESLADRAKAFAERAGLGEEVRVEVALVTGRVLALEKVVEAADAFVQFDAWDPAVEDVRTSLVVPYHQIGAVLMTKAKKQPRGAGFTMKLG